MNNLVIGSSGFVGRVLCDYLRALGEKVIPFDICEDENMDARAATLPMDAIDKVYFLAWEVGGAKYLYQDAVQQLQLEWNLQMMQNVMPQLHQHKIPFLFISSQLAEETDTAYGVTKRLGEVWTHILGGVRIRLWNVYGGYEVVSDRSHVVSDFVWQALETGQIKMLTTGLERRQFIYIDDVCSGFHCAIHSGLTEIFDITSFEWISVRDIADMIADIIGHIEVIPGTKVGRTPITPIQGKLPNWRPKVSLREGLSLMIAKYKGQTLKK